MLIVPMTGKLSWRNPPVITILLLLANCFVYFAFQSGDEEKYMKAHEYYIQSGLAETEIGKFMEYLKAAHRDGEIHIPPEKKMSDPVIVAYLLNKMMSDSEFMKKLSRDEIITPQDPIYPRWKEMKKKYEQMLSQTIQGRYGYIPAEGNFTTAFTYMFLHGSTMHLIGNMIFLWLVGCTLELAGKRSMYLLIYFLTGIISAVFFGWVYRSSTVTLVGASGAISGIIGAYTVLYGRSKVKVFYSLGFYFNYARVAAIYLLPVWIGNEVFQLFFGGVSNVAYVGHIGGLVSGAALGFVQVKVLGGAKTETLQEDRAERIASLMEAGLQKLSALDVQGARTLMNQALEMEPDNRLAQTHLFNIEKLNPDSDEFHSAAENLLLSQHREPDTREALFKTYQEYLRLAKQPKLSPDLLSRLCSAFSQAGHIEDAAKIAALLLRDHPQFPSVPTALLHLSRAYLNAGVTEKGKKCLRLLCQRYPHSPEYGIAEGLLKRTS